MAGSLTPTDKLVIFGLGVALQFDILTSTFGLPFQRLSDLLPFLTIPYFLFRHDVLTAMLGRMLPIGLLVVILTASLVFKADKEQGDVYLTLVLLLYVVQAIQLVILFKDPSGPDCLAAGILLGLVGSLGALAAASAGIDLTAYGLAVPTDGVDAELLLFMQDKLGGLWAGGNETGHVFALAGAAAMYLWFRTGRTAIYLLYVLGLLVSFPMTNNRAGLVVPAIFLVLILRRSFGAYHLLAAAAAVCALVMVFAATGYTPLPEKFQSAIEKRFVSDGNTEANVGERLDSTLGGLRLALTHPFGLGAVATQNQLRAMTGLGTPHNGIVSLAVQSGVFVALAFLVGACRIVLTPGRFGPFAHYTVLFMVPSLMFEELSINQVFLFGIAFVLAASALSRPDDPVIARS
ncbi:O-antigen ligase family protein [uncultured Methylobacterium sp.]|uniref:O-antigen ligase family protein n=1 Tax=uncultured Methylobacterium sp. TaxID=157278 RepID=UPI0035CC09A4